MKKVGLILGSTLLAACGTPASSTTTGGGPYQVLLAMSDYMSAEIGEIAMNGSAVYPASSNLGKDPVLTTSAGRDFWISRDLGSLVEVDAKGFHAGQTFDVNDAEPDGETNTSNPYDVGIAPDGSIWVVRFGLETPFPPSILVLNPDGSRRRSIDLSRFDAEDKNPDASSIQILEPSTGGAGTMATAKAFVTLEVLDEDCGLISTRPSLMVRIDLESGDVEESLVLQGRNPFGLMQRVGTDLYLSEVGGWETKTPGCVPKPGGSGIEVVDTRTFTSRVIATGDALGGHVVELAVNGSCLAAISTGAYPQTPTALVTMDLGSGAIKTAVPQTSTFSLQALLWVNEGTLLVGERTAVAQGGGFPIASFPLGHGCALGAAPATLTVPLPTVAMLGIR